MGAAFDTRAASTPSQRGQGDSEGPGKDEVVNECVVKGRVNGRGTITRIQ